MKKYIIIFICGMLATTALGLGYKKITSQEGFTAKVRQKLKDIRFNKVKRAEHETLLCDFESPADYQLWRLSRVALEPSTDKIFTGKGTARAEFSGGSGSSSMKLADYFSKPGSKNDWSPYQSLNFDIYNPQASRERVLLQVKDKHGKRSKHDVFIDAKAQDNVELDISSLRQEIDIYDIAEFSIFLWDPGQSKVFFIDNVKLVPYGTKDKISMLTAENVQKPQEAYATGDYLDFSSAKKRWLKQESAGDYVEFPFFLANESGLDFISLPFSGGIPFPRGELKDPRSLQVTDKAGNQREFQSKALCLWPDGSVKWLRLDITGSVPAQALEAMRIRYGAGIKAVVTPNFIRVSDNDDNISVDTGKIKFSVKKHNFRLFEEVWLDKNGDGSYQNDEQLASACEMSAGFRGKEYLSSGDSESTLVIEESGPFKAVLRAEGWFKNDGGKKFCKYIVRMTAFYGAGYVKISHTFVYTGYPENEYHYLYKGKGLPKNEPVDKITLSLPYKLSVPLSYTFEVDDKVVQGNLTHDDINFYQESYDKLSVQKAGKKVVDAGQFSGWLDISEQGAGFSVGINKFWQQFPKEYSIKAKEGKVVISLWPERAGKLDLKNTEVSYGPESVARGSAFGLAKTHQIFINFHNGNYHDARARNTISGLLQDLIPKAHPQWIRDTVVLGKVRQYDPRMLRAEETLANLFDWGKRQKEDFKWYGMLDFGDTLSWWRREAYDKSYDDYGWHPEGRWGWFNCEGVGSHAAALLQYLRTGQSKYLEFGQDLARHIMDVDTCHYNTVANDPRLKAKIGDDYSQVGSIHRHNGNHWGDRNEESSHTNLSGILLYYFISGDERAFDVANEIGEFFLKERLTYFRHPDIAPLRSLANVLWGDVEMYGVTQDERYKKAADRLADLLYRGQSNNGSWAENYNPVAKRWDLDPHLGYMNSYVLPALIEYHKLTLNKGIKNSIIKATLYLMKNDEYSHMFDSLAYSYWLTGEKRFREDGVKRLEHLIAHQHRTQDPLMNGMIYQKAIYARFVDFLYRTPFILEVAAQ